MFRQVYFHRTLRSAEAVLRSVLRRALELVEAGEEVWCAPGTAFEKVLHRQTLTLEDHLEMDDSDVLFHLKQWRRAKDTILHDLSHRFIGRRLFKAIDLDMAAGAPARAGGAPALAAPQLAPLLPPPLPLVRRGRSRPGSRGPRGLRGGRRFRAALLLHRR